MELRDAEIDKSNFDRWLEGIIRSFDIPIGECHNDRAIQDDIIREESGIAAVDTDTKHRNLARALNDSEVTERAYRRVYGQNTEE